MRLLLACLLALPSVAAATVPDLYGLGARSMGMGGGGIAIVDDGPSAMINPAGLSRMRMPSAGLGLSAAIEDFDKVPDLWWDTNRDGTIDESDPPLHYDAGVDDAIGMHFFLGRHIGSKFGIGIAGYVPVNRLLRFETFEPSLPTYFMYDNRTQRYSLAIAVGGKIVKGLHVGLGVDFVPRARLEVVMTADATLTGNTDANGNVSDVFGSMTIDVHQMTLDLVPGFAPIVGIQLEFGEWTKALDGLLFAATYRGEVGLPIQVDLDAQVNVNVTDVGDLNPFVTAIVVNAGLRLFDHFVPRTLTAGLAWKADRWSLYADGKWTDWSRMVLNVTKLENVNITAPLLDIPEEDIHDGNAFDATFRDTLSARIGGEFIVSQKEVQSRWKYWKFRVRVGGGYEPSALAAQGVSSSLLDSRRLYGTVGAGIETWDPLQLIDAPVKIDVFGQMHLLQHAALDRSAAEPVAGNTRDGTPIPYGGYIGVFGAQIGFDYH